MRGHHLGALLSIVVAGAGCGADDDAARVSASARVLHGPTGAGGATAAAGPVVPSDGRWAITPTQAQLTLVSLDFTRLDGQPEHVVLTDCAPTYVATGASLTELLDCPFEVAEGTYVAVSLGVSTTYQLLLDDPATGFYTDPTAATKVVTAPPAGGAQSASFTVSGPGGVGDVLNSATFFSESLVVAADQPVSIDILVDMIHMLAITVDGGTPTVDVSAPAVPAMLVPSASGAGRAEFYSVNPTAANLLIGPVGSTGNWGGVRAFYAEPPQPSFIFNPVPGPSEAYNVDPADAPADQMYKAGGYLGVDDTNTMCWALPANDASYTTYQRLCRMPVVGLGEATTISCQTMSTVPSPVSGSTYASGCPEITADITVPVTLIAD